MISRGAELCLDDCFCLVRVRDQKQHRIRRRLPFIQPLDTLCFDWGWLMKSEGTGALVAVPAEGDSGRGGLVR